MVFPNGQRAISIQRAISVLMISDNLRRGFATRTSLEEDWILIDFLTYVRWYFPTGWLDLGNGGEDSACMHYAHVVNEDLQSKYIVIPGAKKSWERYFVWWSHVICVDNSSLDKVDPTKKLMGNDLKADRSRYGLKRSTPSRPRHEKSSESSLDNPTPLPNRTQA